MIYGLLIYLGIGFILSMWARKNQNEKAKSLYNEMPTSVKVVTVMMDSVTSPILTVVVVVVLGFIKLRGVFK